MNICPACGELLRDDAVACTHCGHRLGSIPAAARRGFTPTPPVQKIGCGLLVTAGLAATLWGFSTVYQDASPEGTEAIHPTGSQDSP